MQKQDRMEKIFANHISDRDLDLGYIRHSQKSERKSNHEMGKEMRNFTEGNILITNKNKKRCSTSLVIRKMQSKTQ